MIVVEMKRHFRERAIEWWSASMLTIWGAYVLLNPNMFVEVPSLHGMLILAPQHVWGFLGFVSGLLRLAALTINGFWQRTPLIRLITSFIGVFVWFWIFIGMVLSDLAQTGIVVYGWHMVADMYSAFRSASDTYEAEAQRRLTQISSGDNPNVSRLHSSS